MRLNVVLLLLSLGVIALVTFFLDQGGEVFRRQNLPLTMGDTVLSPSRQKAPNFSFKTLEGTSSSLETERKKNVGPIILHFWASWCAPCVSEFPALLSMARQNETRVTILAISTDIAPDKIKKFLKKQRPPLPSNVKIIWDKDKKLTEDLFQTFKLPETIILDRGGGMVQKEIGVTDWSSPAFQRFLDTL